MAFVFLWSLCCLPVMKIQEIDEFKWHTFHWRSWIQCASSYVSLGVIVKLLKFVCNNCNIPEEQEHCWKNKKILACFVLLMLLFSWSDSQNYDSSFFCCFHSLLLLLFWLCGMFFKNGYSSWYLFLLKQCL